MYITPRLLILILFVHTYPCFGYEEEVLKLETKRGIWKLLHDFQNGNVKDNVLEYFPDEIEELLGLVEKYFMGKHRGYSRSKVLTFNIYILRSSLNIKQELPISIITKLFLEGN